MWRAFCWTVIKASTGSRSVLTAIMSRLEFRCQHSFETHVNIWNRAGCPGWLVKEFQIIIIKLFLWIFTYLYNYWYSQFLKNALLYKIDDLKEYEFFYYNKKNDPTLNWLSSHSESFMCQKILQYWQVVITLMRLLFGIF